ncbi:MAG: hypothetical protein ACOZF0_10065 [Thermodesulfobacteriota bacterium]
MRDIEANLRRYLAMERLLNEFFAASDYCLKNCIQVEMRKNGNRPVAGCCRKPYYTLYDLDHPAFALLKREREKRFGKPGDCDRPTPVSPCEYHSPNAGCLLSSHKSPVCIAFVCREYVDYLRNRFGLYAYDYLGVYYALEWILTGDFTDGQYREFGAGIRAMIAAIK